jgi:ParB family transcriptional regulator, chromosome partitioning protein
VPLEKLMEPVIPARSAFDAEKLQDLRDSIRAVGFIFTPLIVEEEGEKYRIHAGHRRYTAAKSEGLASVPCMIWRAGSVLAEAVKSHENTVREDLNVADEAVYFRRLLEEVCGGDVDRLVALVKQKESYVQQRLGLILGDPSVFQGLEAGVISIGVAEELNKIKSAPRRQQYLLVAAQGGCTVRQMRDWRVQGNLADAENANAPIDVSQLGPAPPPPPHSDVKCYICLSDKDQHEMQVRFVHSSCERMLERRAAAQEG